MAPGAKRAGKKTLLEYRKPKTGKEFYLGKCENFTKKQTEALAREMPAYFLSIGAHEGPKGICLFSGGVFAKSTLNDMIGKLKRSCTRWAGKGSERACRTLIKNISPKKRIAAPKSKPIRKKTLLEYRKPIPGAEPFLGKCEKFTKGQIEAVAAEMPAYFKTIAGLEDTDGSICLFSGQLFKPNTLEDMIEKLKASCTKWAGKGSKGACETLVENLKSSRPTKEKPIKSYDPHDISNYRGWPLVAKNIDAGITAFWFTVLAIVIHGALKLFTGRGIIARLKSNGKNNNNDDDLPKPPRTGGTQEQPKPRSDSIAGLAGKYDHGYVAAIAPELSFEIFALRVLKVLGPEAGHDFIMQRGHDFESLNLLPAAAFEQTVKEYAMWDGVVDAPVSTVANPARDLIASGAAYLNQAHVKASIQKFRVESVGEKFALLRSRDGRLYSMSKMKLPERVRVGSVVAVKAAALRPAPRPRVRVGVRGFRFGW